MSKNSFHKNGNGNNGNPGGNNNPGGSGVDDMNLMPVGGKNHNGGGNQNGNNQGSQNGGGGLAPQKISNIKSEQQDRMDEAVDNVKKGVASEPVEVPDTNEGMENSEGIGDVQDTSATGNTDNGHPTTLSRNTEAIKQTDGYLSEVRAGFAEDYDDYRTAIDIKIASLKEEIEALEDEKEKISALYESLKVY